MSHLFRLLLAALFVGGCLVTTAGAGYAQSTPPYTGGDYPGFSSTTYDVQVHNGLATRTTCIYNFSGHGAWVGIATYRIFGQQPNPGAPASEWMNYFNHQQFYDTKTAYVCSGSCVCLTVCVPTCTACQCTQKQYQGSCSNGDQCQYQLDVFVGCPIYCFPGSDYYGFFNPPASPPRLITGDPPGPQADPVVDNGCWEGFWGYWCSGWRW